MRTTSLRQPVEVTISAGSPDQPRDAVTARTAGAKDRSRPFLSVVIPALNEADNLPVLHERLGTMMERVGVDRWEMLVVDDGSTDGTLDVLRSLAADDPRVRYISLSRNFGHQPALRAGMDHTRGDCVVAMDADLQHPPALVAQMLDKWRDGFDVISTLREDVKQAGLFKRVTSGGFYRLLNLLGEVRIEPGSADFYLLDAAVVDAIRALPESEVFFRGMLPWLGFRCQRVVYRPDPRLHGHSKYRLRKMFSLALTGIMATSIQPLRFATYLAAIVAGLTLAYGVWVLLSYLGIFGVSHTVPGWTSVILVVAVLGAMQLLVLGIIGEYLGRVLRETRRRPAYIIRATNCVHPGAPVERVASSPEAH